MTKYVEEFVYRGRPPSSDAPPAWHVRLGSETPSAFGAPPAIEISDPMTVTDAEAAGWPLAAVLGGVAAAATARADDLQGKYDAAVAELDEMDALRDRLDRALQKITELSERLGEPAEVNMPDAAPLEA